MKRDGNNMARPQDLTATQPMAGAAAAKTQPNHAPNAMPLLCIEACTHVVSAARKVARENHEAKEKEKAQAG